MRISISLNGAMFAKDLLENLEESVTTMSFSARAAI